MSCIYFSNCSTSLLDFSERFSLLGSQESLRSMTCSQKGWRLGCRLDFFRVGSEDGRMVADAAVWALKVFRPVGVRPCEGTGCAGTGLVRGRVLLTRHVPLLDFSFAPPTRNA